ncbi:MAG: hypothetical protein J5633_00270, partial [Oscillospiraceae bacterium]|nr:hypothetical protein [Oscillospiraceae bacterium]
RASSSALCLISMIFSFPGGVSARTLFGYSLLKRTVLFNRAGKRRYKKTLPKQRPFLGGQ